MMSVSASDTIGFPYAASQIVIHKKQRNGHQQQQQTTKWNEQKTAA